MLKEAPSESVNTYVKPGERFEEVTDHSNVCEEKAHKLLNSPTNSNVATKPADLDLD